MSILRQLQKRRRSLLRDEERATSEKTLRMVDQMDQMRSKIDKPPWNPYLDMLFAPPFASYKTTEGVAEAISAKEFFKLSFTRASMDFKEKLTQFPIKYYKRGKEKLGKGAFGTVRV